MCSRSGLPGSLLGRLLAVLRAQHHRLPLTDRFKRRCYRRLCQAFPARFGLADGRPPAWSTLRHGLEAGTVLASDPTSSMQWSLSKHAHIKSGDQPRVSIGMVGEGSLNSVLACLHAISARTARVSYEVVVAVSGLSQQDHATLSTIRGVRLLSPKQLAQGAPATHWAVAAMAQGELLCLLDSHTEVGVGWLDTLVQTFEDFPGAGMVVFPSRQPQGPWPVEHAQEVERVHSSAGMMLPLALFLQCGQAGSADLAQEIIQAGYRVIHQPQAIVLRQCQPLATCTVPFSRVHAQKKRRALVMDHATPTPDRDAGSVTALNLMLLLREMAFEVSFIPEASLRASPGYTEALQRVGIEALHRPAITSVKQHLRQQGPRYELVLLIRPAVVEATLQTVRRYCPQARVLFETADLHYLRMQRQAKLYNDSRLKSAVERMKQRELRAINAVDATMIRSTAERALLQPLVPHARLYVFPLILELAGSAAAFNERSDLLFVGGFQHTPNVDAVKYFVTSIMPELRKRLPGLRLYAVGSHPPPEIRQLTREDVIITGFVKDLAAMLNRARVSVAPLRYGAGIKGKIGTAMAAGLPVVATPVAAEGMSLIHEETVLVAQGPDAFAQAVARLYQDAKLWNQLSQNGLDFARNMWGADAAWQTLAGILTDLDLPVERRPFPLSLYKG